jgi:hypothetical protein
MHAIYKLPHGSPEQNGANGHKREGGGRQGGLRCVEKQRLYSDACASRYRPPHCC